MQSDDIRSFVCPRLSIPVIADSRSRIKAQIYKGRKSFRIPDLRSSVEYAPTNADPNPFSTLELTIRDDDRELRAEDRDREK
jgi:hypothetical protein